MSEKSPDAADMDRQSVSPSTDSEKAFSRRNLSGVPKCTGRTSSVENRPVFGAT